MPWIRKCLSYITWCISYIELCIWYLTKSISYLAFFISRTTRYTFSTTKSMVSRVISRVFGKGGGHLHPQGGAHRGSRVQWGYLHAICTEIWRRLKKARNVNRRGVKMANSYFLCPNIDKICTVCQNDDIYQTNCEQSVPKNF